MSDTESDEAHTWSYGFTLSEFERDKEGRAQYNLGIRQREYRLILTVTMLPQYESDAAIMVPIYRHIDRCIRTEMDNNRNSLLLDNNDVFLHNMQSPQMTDAMNELLEKTPLISLRDHVPPLSRLNFPFLVGRAERNLIGDYCEYIAGRTKEKIMGFVITAFPVNIYPITDVDYEIVAR